MKLIINKIVLEFNKIFSGSKRVGDSLKLEGRRMSQLDVANSNKLGSKTESELSVDTAVLAEKSGLIQSFDINGNPYVSVDGNNQSHNVYVKENQLSVNNTQHVKGVEPLNLEVDISRRLKVGSEPLSPVINVSDLVTDANIPRVKDSGLLVGKLEKDLIVSRSGDADNADLLNDTAQADLVVEKSRISTKLLNDAGTAELKESQLRVSSAEFVRKGTENLDVYDLRDYFFATEQAKDVYVDLSAASNGLTTDDGTKSFSEILSHIKTDTDSEAYKAKHIIVSSDTNSPNKTGDTYKTWLIAHDDFKNKVATLNSKTTDRAKKFGTDSDNVTISEMDTRIKATKVSNAVNADTVNSQTDEDIITTARSRILSNASGTNGLTQGEVDGFFGNNKVKISVQGIKVKEADDADTLETYTLAQIKTQVKNEGQVASAKYLYSDPSNSGSGTKSYINIKTDINNAKAAVIGTATTGYDTLGEIETIVKANKTSAEGLVTGEATARSNADGSLQNNIDVEKGRIDTILENATVDQDTFAGLKAYIDGLTGDLTTNTTLGANDTASVINITEALETRLAAAENATTQSSGNLGGEIDNIEAAVGLKTNGDLAKITGTNYINNSSTILAAIENLDIALNSESVDRSVEEATLQENIDTVSNNLTTEVTRAKGVEGTLTSLATTAKGTLVAAINELRSDLDTEVNTRGTNDGTLQDNIDDANDTISTETTRAKGVEGKLTDLTTDAQTTLVASINEVDAAIAAEVTRATNAESALGTNITTEKGRITQEITDRGNADTALGNRINNITGVSTAAYAAASTTNYIKTATSLFVADQLLDAKVKFNFDTNSDAISDEVTRATNAEAALQTNITTEQGRITKTVTGLGFGTIDEDGAIAISGTNYINDATDVSTAVKTLDTKIKEKETSLISLIAQTADIYGDDSAVSFDYDKMATTNRASFNIVNIGAGDTSEEIFNIQSDDGNETSGMTVITPLTTKADIIAETTVISSSFTVKDEASGDHEITADSTDGLTINGSSVVITTSNISTNETSHGSITLGTNSIKNTTDGVDLTISGTGTGVANIDGNAATVSTVLTSVPADVVFTDSTKLATLATTNKDSLVDAINELVAKVVDAPFRVPSATTAERDDFTAVNGDMIFNTTTNKLQAYQVDTWINIDGTV